MEKIYENDLNIEKALENETKCIDLLKYKFKYEGALDNPPNGYWVLKDGTILNCGAHGNIDNFLIKQGYITNNSNKFNVFDGSQFMDKIGAARLRNEVYSIHTPAYLTIPLEPMAEIQKKIVFDWIFDVLIKIKTYLIVDTGFTAKRYERFEDEKAIEDIKFYYRTRKEN